MNGDGCGRLGIGRKKSFVFLIEGIPPTTAGLSNKPRNPSKFTSYQTSWYGPLCNTFSGIEIGGFKPRTPTGFGTTFQCPSAHHIHQRVQLEQPQPATSYHLRCDRHLWRALQPFFDIPERWIPHANAASRLPSSRGYPVISPVQLGNTITPPGCKQNATLTHPGLEKQSEPHLRMQVPSTRSASSRLSPQAQTRSRVTAPTFRDVALD